MKRNTIFLPACSAGILLTFLLLGIPEKAVYAQESLSSDLPRLYIAGNSTASNGADLGWGSHLQKYFDPGAVVVDNRARAGRSSRTFITEGWWDSLYANLKPGDFVLIEFGHNDAGKINDDRRARGSIPELGEKTVEIDNLLTGKHELVHTFGWYMRKMINDVREKGATPIVLSMTARNVWPGGEIERENTFCMLAAQIANQEEVAFIDLRNMIADQYEFLGPLRVGGLFPVDHTHTSARGADINAAMVVSGLKMIASPLGTMMSTTGASIPPYGADVLLETVEDFMVSTWMPGVQPESDSSLPALYAIGNSTVRNGTLGDGSNGEWGWGAPLADYFDRSLINVENRALGGTSSRTFRAKGLWAAVLEDLKPGDFVIMQFGHNDSSPINDEHRARGTIKGNGEDRQEIDNMLTGKRETVHSYGWYLRQYIRESRDKGAIPIVCSLIPRNNWSGGKVERSVNSYAQWAKEAALQEGAFFIDLNQLISDFYDAEGEDRVAALYFPPGEKTHTNALGALINARCLLEGIGNIDDLSLNDYSKTVEPQ